MIARGPYLSRHSLEKILCHQDSTCRHTRSEAFAFCMPCIPLKMDAICAGQTGSGPLFDDCVRAGGLGGRAGDGVASPTRVQRIGQSATILAKSI